MSIRYTCFYFGGPFTIQNLPLAGAEPPNSQARRYIDLRGFVMVRLQYPVSTASALISMRLDFSIDDGTTWQILVPALSAQPIANAINRSPWTALPDSARRENTLVRAFCFGNGALDPVFNSITMEAAD